MAAATGGCRHVPPPRGCVVAVCVVWVRADARAAGGFGLTISPRHVPVVVIARAREALQIRGWVDPSVDTNGRRGKSGGRQMWLELGRVSGVDSGVGVHRRPVVLGAVPGEGARRCQGRGGPAMESVIDANILKLALSEII